MKQSILNIIDWLFVLALILVGLTVTYMLVMLFLTFSPFYMFLSSCGFVSLAMIASKVVDEVF